MSRNISTQPFEDRETKTTTFGVKEIYTCLLKSIVTMRLNKHKGGCPTSCCRCHYYVLLLPPFNNI